MQGAAGEGVSMELRIKEITYSDLEGIKIYYRECFTEEYFAALENGIYKKFDLIISNPKMGAPVKIAKLKHFRWVIEGAYFIFYTLGKDFISIERIIHTARDIKKVLGSNTP